MFKTRLNAKQLPLKNAKKKNWKLTEDLTKKKTRRGKEDK